MKKRASEAIMIGTDIRHVAWKRADGKIINPKCEHSLTPGLDADYCHLCRTYYIDAFEVEVFYSRKKAGIFH